MAAFDRIDGIFTTRFADGRSGCTKPERFRFQRNGWTWCTKTKGWITPDIEKARPLIKHAVGAALDHLITAERVREAAVATSWAEDTEATFPAPDGLNYLPFQKAGIEIMANRNKSICADPMGLGKSQPKTEPVLTPSGWVEIGTLNKGDTIFGGNGELATVTNVFEQGTLPTYNVDFNDGSYAECSATHLWRVYNTSFTTNSWQTLSLENIMDRKIRAPSGRRKFKVPLVLPIQFSSKKFLIDPYFLGLLLGDGALSTSTIQLGMATKDLEELIPNISVNIVEPYGLKVHNAGAFSYLRVSRGLGINSPSIYVDEINRLGLRCIGKHKQIPTEYMLGAHDQRLELLQGLLDSDGTCSKEGRVRFSSTAESLALGVQHLVWSLGGQASISFSDRSSREYSVSINIAECPFKLARKKNRWKRKTGNYAPSRHMNSAVYVGEKEHVCISVDSVDSLYITRDYTVTHNTVQAIGVHNATNTARVLVVCPASLKVNWKREWEKWDVHGLTVGIAHSKTATKVIRETIDGVEEKWTKRWTEHVWPDTDVVIINYDMLDAFDTDVKDNHWDLLICDEAHLLKTKGTVRTMCVFGGTRKAARKHGKIVRPARTYAPIDAERTLFLTGTPIMSKPIELWNLIRVCDPKGLGRNWDDFVFEYCGAYYDGNHLDTSGASNSEELNRLMRERFLVRRDKRSVLNELPDKTRELIMLPQDKLEAPLRKEQTRMETALNTYEDLLGISEEDRAFRYIKAIDSLSDKLIKALEEQDSETPDWDAAVKTMEEPDQILFTEISLAREEVAIAKVGMVVDHIQKLIESDEPVICFAYHKSVVAVIKERLEKAGISVGIVTGSVASNKRQAIVDDFQDGKYDVILGNIIAMGVGFTLTRARFVVFAELDWVPALIEQAEDRAWRYGQINAVLVQHLVVDGSIEARMAIALLEKMGVIHVTLDHRDTPYIHDADVGDG
jgi:hypothetical protein